MSEYIGDGRIPIECIRLHEGMKRKYKTYQNIVEQLKSKLKISE